MPSLWVALYEGLFECRIPEIDRSFQDVTSPGSRLRNVELVLRELETSVLRMDLSHIKSYALVNRDDRTIRNLIDIFHEIAKSMDAEAEGSLNSNERKDLEEILSTVKEAPTDPTTSGSHESSSYEVLNSNLEPGSILESSSIANITTESRISSAGIPDMSQISPTTRKRKRKLYRGRSPIKEIQDDVLQFGKKTEQAPIEFSEEQLAQPERKTKVCILLHCS